MKNFARAFVVAALAALAPLYPAQAALTGGASTIYGQVYPSPAPTLLPNQSGPFAMDSQHRLIVAPQNFVGPNPLTVNPYTTQTAVTATFGAQNASKTLPLNGASCAGVNIAGTFTGYIAYQASSDGINYVPVSSTENSPGLSGTGTATGQTALICPAGKPFVQLTMTSWTNGSANVTITPSFGTGGVVTGVSGIGVSVGGYNDGTYAPPLLANGSFNFGYNRASGLWDKLSVEPSTAGNNSGIVQTADGGRATFSIPVSSASATNIIVSNHPGRLVKVTNQSSNPNAVLDIYDSSTTNSGTLIYRGALGAAGSATSSLSVQVPVGSGIVVRPETATNSDWPILLQFT